MNDNTRKVSGRNGNTQLNIYHQLDEAGFDVGDRVQVESGDGYVVIAPAKADVPISEVAVEDRPNVKNNPIESDYEARVVGNRLWNRAETIRQSGYDNIADETQELARRFHAYANGDNE